MKVCRIISLMLILCVIISVFALNAVSANDLANSALRNSKVTDVLYVLSTHSYDSDNTFGDIIETNDVIQLNENLAYYKDGGAQCDTCFLNSRDNHSLSNLILPCRVVDKLLSLVI